MARRRMFSTRGCIRASEKPPRRSALGSSAKENVQPRRGSRIYVEAAAEGAALHATAAALGLAVSVAGALVAALAPSLLSTVPITP